MRKFEPIDDDKIKPLVLPTKEEKPSLIRQAKATPEQQREIDKELGWLSNLQTNKLDSFVLPASGKALTIGEYTAIKNGLPKGSFSTAITAKQLEFKTANDKRAKAKANGNNFDIPDGEQLTTDPALLAQMAACEGLVFYE